MKLPPSLHFLRPGWWAVHVVAIALVAGGGLVAGLHHAERDAGHRGHGTPAPATSGDPVNPVQAEMRLLERALATAPASFAAGDIRPFEHQLHAVHAAKEKTEEAIHHGAYRLPKNADEVERFTELDREFHAALEELAEHAAKNELAPAASAYGDVLAACNGCHSEFR